MANEWSRYCSICSVTLSIKTWYRNKFVIWCTDVCKVYIEIKLYVVLKLSFWSSSCARCLDQMELEVQRYLNDSRNTNTEVVTPTNHNRSKQRHEPINYLQVRKNRRYRMIGFGLPSHWLKNWRDIFKPTSKRSNRKCVIKEKWLSTSKYLPFGLVDRAEKRLRMRAVDSCAFSIV